jgi:formamidopyrimidine-DNA glycosylase
MHEVLEAAIHYEGSTLSDGTYRNALNRAGDYQKFHRVYGRKGEPCLDCGEANIERIVQAQRSTFFCPNCQRRRAARSIRAKKSRAKKSHAESRRGGGRG